MSEAAQPAQPSAADKKKSNKRIILIVVILLILLGGGFAAWHFWLSPEAKLRRLAKKESKKEQISGGGGGGSTTSSEPKKPTQGSVAQPAPPTGNDTFPLKKGSQGDNVLYIKRAVNRLLPVGYTKLKEDKNFDEALYVALVTKFGTVYYPLKQDKWMELMKKSNELVK